MGYSLAELLRLFWYAYSLLCLRIKFICKPCEFVCHLRHCKPKTLHIELERAEWPYCTNSTQVLMPF